MPGSRRYPRGVFALETACWSSDLSDDLSIGPLLAVLRASGNPPLPIIHKMVATSGELAHYLDMWTMSRHARYPVLWLSFHGGTERLFLGDRRRSDNIVNLNWLEERLEGRCHGRIIHIGACSTLRDVHGNRLRRFLARTRALAVTGFERDVDWFDASLFEVAMIRETGLYVMDRRGMRGFQRHLRRTMGQAARRLAFRLVLG